MGMERFGDHLSDRVAAPPRPIDPGPDEGALETSHRGESALGLVFAELDSDQTSAPTRVLALQIAGQGRELLGGSRDRTSTAAIVGRQSIQTGLAVAPPDLPNRAIRDREFGRDLSQRGALLMTTYNLVTERN